MRKLIVEADGGSRGNPGPAGYGALVRDADTGEILAEKSESIGVATNNVAEYSGLIAGLRAAKEIDPRASVQVRMDSKLVVEQMSGRWKIKHPDMKPLARTASEAADGFSGVTYEWVPRERNQDADRLANEAMDSAERNGGGSRHQVRPRPAGAAAPSSPGGSSTSGSTAPKAQAAGSTANAQAAGDQRGGDQRGGDQRGGASPAGEPRRGRRRSRCYCGTGRRRCRPSGGSRASATSS